MQYWAKATVGLPYYSRDGEVAAPAHGRHLYFGNDEQSFIACAILNSSLFYVYFIAYGDCFHLSDSLVKTFPIVAATMADRKLASLGRELMNSLKQGATRKSIQTRDGYEIGYDEFNGAASKHIIDEIDKLLGSYIGLNEDELDFIVNYDIKYRMGSGGGEDEE